MLERQSDKASHQFLKLAGWLVAWLVGWLVAWLVGWLHGVMYLLQSAVVQTKRWH